MALFRGFYVRGIACGLGSMLLAIAFGAGILVDRLLLQ